MDSKEFKGSSIEPSKRFCLEFQLKQKSQTTQRLIPDSVGELPPGLLLQIRIAAQDYTV